MKVYIMVVIGLMAGMLSTAQNIKPVNADATPEAKVLLQYLNSLKGKHILSGQHNYLGTKSESTDEVHSITGKYPAVWGSDFGFTAKGIDDIHYRDTMVQQAIQRHSEGFIITLMWHAVRPIDDEPNGWKESVQNELSEDEWTDLVTPGTEIHKRWLAQLDVVAEYLKALQNANIPVLWRPYHEMNGSWFWWGDKKGKEGYQALWRNMYSYFTNHHQLNNLIWVWNANSLRNEHIGDYHLYFPGLDVVDIVASDYYGENPYTMDDYQKLKKLAKGKPIAIGECGPLPNAEILKQQPDWCWFMCWARLLTEKNSTQEILDVYKNEKVLNVKDVDLNTTK